MISNSLVSQVVRTSLGVLVGVLVGVASLVEVLSFGLVLMGVVFLLFYDGFVRCFA